jgi:hypothetical protein
MCQKRLNLCHRLAGARLPGHGENLPRALASVSKEKRFRGVANGVANVVLRLLSNVVNTNDVAIYE